jgi:hypothetical protein
VAGDTDRGKLKYREKNLSELYFVHDKTDVDWQPGFEPSVRGERLVTDCRSWGTTAVTGAGARLPLATKFSLYVRFVISLIMHLFSFFILGQECN